MRWMRERLNREEGFTLIELMVVVLIIAVLVAIAIPSFLGFRNRAQDRSAQADLRNALLAEKAYWTDQAMFTVVEADLKSYEPSLVVDPASSAALGVYTEMPIVLDDDVVCIARVSQSKNYFMVYEDASATGGTYYGSFKDPTVVPSCPTATPSGANWSNVSFPAPV